MQSLSRYQICSFIFISQETEQGNLLSSYISGIATKLQFYAYLGSPGSNRSSQAGPICGTENVTHHLTFAAFSPLPSWHLVLSQDSISQPCHLLSMA